jgi:hypothetical protein
MTSNFTAFPALNLQFHTYQLQIKLCRNLAKDALVWENKIPATCFSHSKLLHGIKGIRGKDTTPGT